MGNGPPAAAGFSRGSSSPAAPRVFAFTSSATRRARLDPEPVWSSGLAPHTTNADGNGISQSSEPKRTLRVCPIRGEMRRMYDVRKLSLVELGTHVEVAMVVRSSAHGEQSMVAGLFRHLTSEMLLLWDRGFFSYELWKQMIARRVKVLARVKSGIDLAPDPPPGRRLVSGQDLQERLRPEEGPRRDRGPSDPLHARRPATGRPRRGACPDYESFG